MNITKFKEFEFCLWPRCCDNHQFEFPWVFLFFFASLPPSLISPIRLQIITKWLSDWSSFSFCFFFEPIINPSFCLYFPLVEFVVVSLLLNESKFWKPSSSCLKLIESKKKLDFFFVLVYVELLFQKFESKQIVIPRYTSISFFVCCTWFFWNL